MHYRNTLACGVAVIAISAAAQASAQTSGNRETAAGSAAVEEVVVTGSRAIRDGSAAPTPVTVLSAETLSQTAPGNIPDALNRMPQFAGSSSQYRSATFNATAGLQGNYLNLRALGTQRVLVLLDGTRVPPTSSTNAVDSNTLPQMLIERVDVVTGGASAAYGSDAVSGVVNYILNNRFKGVSAVAQGGLSQEGDAKAYRLGLAAGRGFAGDDGHVEFSVERYSNKGVDRQDRRPYYDRLALIVGNGSAASPFTQILNARYNDLTFGGLIRSGPLAGNSFNPDGSVSPFVPGAPTTTSNIAAGGQGAYVPPTVLFPSLETNQAFGRASYELGDNLEMFVQGSYGRSETSYLSAYPARRAGTGNGITIFADNPYLTSAVRTALGATPSFGLSRSFSDSPGNLQRSITESYNLKAGITGKIGDKADWDLTYVHGKAELNLSQLEQNNRNFYAAIDTTRNANGQIVCRVSLVNPQLVPGCMPLNPMGLGNLDAAALAFIRQESRSTIENKLDLVAANIRGDVFQLPAGAVSVAVGGEVRQQNLRQTTNADPTSIVDYTGIRGVPNGVLPFSTTNVGRAAGSQRVKEAYAELAVPVLRDLPWAKNLDLNGAVRYTDYKLSGAVKTWKLGAIYEPVEGVRLRTTASRDIAAPSLFDMFAGSQAAIMAQFDPHTGLTAALVQVTQGNKDLKPEKADTFVGGLVLNPTFAPRLTVSIDAYSIKINDAIATTDGQTQNFDCEASGGTAPVCAAISRPGPFTDRSQANFPTQIIVSPRNQAELKVQGVDLEASYTAPLDDVWALGGSLDFRAFVSYLDSYDTKASANAPVVHRAGRVTTLATTGGLPRWRGNFRQAYRRGDFMVQLAERYSGRYMRTAIEAFDPNYVRADDRLYTDLYVSQGLKDNRYVVFFQVENLFNVSPPLLAATVNPGFTYPTDKGNYDILGRNFTAGLRMRF